MLLGLFLYHFHLEPAPGGTLELPWSILVESLWAQTDQNRIPSWRQQQGLLSQSQVAAVLRRQWRSCFMRPNVRDCRWNSLSAGAASQKTNQQPVLKVWAGLRWGARIGP